MPINAVGRPISGVTDNGPRSVAKMRQLSPQHSHGRGHKFETCTAHPNYSMSQLHFYVPEEIEAKTCIQAKQAKRAKLTLSKDLADIIECETAAQSQWARGAGRA